MYLFLFKNIQVLSLVVYHKFSDLQVFCTPEILHTTNINIDNFMINIRFTDIALIFLITNIFKIFMRK